MAQIDPAGGNPKQKKKSASSPSRRRAGRSTKKSASPETKSVPDEPPAPASVSRLERTRRLLLAALRVWELKRRIRD